MTLTEQVIIFRARKNILVELIDSMATYGARGECDDCHNQTIVVTDPATADHP